MAKDLSCLYCYQSGSRAQQAFYSMGTRGSLLGDEVASTYLMPRLRMSGGLPTLPHVPTWCPQGQLYLYSNHSLKLQYLRYKDLTRFDTQNSI